MKVLRTMGLVLVLGMVAACGSDGDEPDIETDFSKQLPQGWELTDFDIEAREDVGTEVEPARKYRFSAEFAPTEDLYLAVGKLGVIDVLQTGHKKGAEVKVVGIADAELIGETWESAFDVSGTPFNFYAAGTPKSAFAGDAVVIGSSEYKKLIKATEQRAETLAREIEEQTSLFSEKQNEFNTLSQQLQSEQQTAATQLRELRQELSGQQRELQQQSSQQASEVQRQQQQAVREKTEALKAATNARTVELNEAYQVAEAGFNAELQEARKQRSASRKAASSASRERLAQARSSLSREDYRTLSAQASADLKQQYQQIEQQFAEVSADIKARAGAANDRHREQLVAIGEQYKQQVTEWNAAAKAVRDEAQAELREATQAELARLNEQRQAAQGSHQTQVKSAQQNLNQKRSELNDLAKEITRQRTRYNTIMQQLQAVPPQD